MEKITRDKIRTLVSQWNAQNTSTGGTFNVTMYPTSSNSTSTTSVYQIKTYDEIDVLIEIINNLIDATAKFN